MRAMTTGSSTDRAPPVNTSMVTRARARRRPLLPMREQTCIVLYMKINGIQALTLLDSGSTGDSVSTDFARVARMKTFELENPMTLQLGCSGSRTKISHGSEAPLALGQFIADTYFDSRKKSWILTVRSTEVGIIFLTVILLTRFGSATVSYSISAMIL